MEFAVVSPLFIAFMLTAVYFGIYISLAHSVQQLAADAARTSVAGLSEAERRLLSETYVHASAEEYFLLSGDRLGAGFHEDGGAFVVTLTYDASPLLSWYPAGMMPVLGTTITRTAVVRYGGL